MEKISIKDLKLAEYNPRYITDEAFNGLKNSIKRFGIPQPVIVNKRTGNLVGGHMRTRACEALGIEEVPVVYVDLDEKEEKALNITLNNKNISGDFTDGLQLILQELKTDFLEYDDLKLCDLEMNISPNVVGLTDEDSVPEVKEPITKPGDIWILGNHRVMCGDSTMIDHVEKLMGGDKADMTFTSPPYNGNTRFNPGKGTPNLNTGKLYDNYDDNLPKDEYLNLTRAVLSNCLLKTKRFVFWNCNYNTNSRSEFLEQIYSSIEHLHETIIWKKTALPVQSGLCRVWEPIFVLSMMDKKNRIGTNGKTEFNFWEVSNNGTLQNNHRAGFPIALVERAIELENPETILEPFLGTGSTLIACEKTNRKCYGMEIDPHYCDVIVKRWEGFTGKSAILLNA